MLAEALAAEEGKAVAHPCGETGDSKGLKPDIAEAYDHEHCKLEAGIGKPEHRAECALTRDVLTQYARKESKIDGAGKNHHVPEKPDFQRREEVHQRNDRLHRKIAVHNSGGAAYLKLFKVAAELVGAENTGGGEEQDAGDRGEKNAGKADNDEHDGGDDTSFQYISLFLIFAGKQLFYIKIAYYPARLNMRLCSCVRFLGEKRGYLQFLYFYKEIFAAFLLFITEKPTDYLITARAED